jgi:DNA-binding NarL/FixJ family response regulator
MDKKIKTLIVEDNADFRQIIKEILFSKFPLMLIKQAADGREALIKLVRDRPDLIFVDIELAGENGLMLTKKFKKIHSHAVIIILTHHDLPEYREAAYQNGAQYFLSKETTKADEIAALVESIVEGVERT